MASYLHHTATTIYLCFVPDLEDSTGAGCVGLAAAKIRLFAYLARLFWAFYPIVLITYLSNNKNNKNENP